jgi:hypothetical protein
MTELGMDYSEMLFAAEVRKLAGALRQDKRKEVQREYSNAEEADQRDALDAWDNEYPLSAFVPRAYAEIAEVVKQVEALREAGGGSGDSFWESTPPQR